MITEMLPCSFYDIQGLQNWLDEMALRGLFFQRFSTFDYSAKFLADTPRPVRYRLDPAGQSKKAERERRELYAQMGWSFVSARPMMYSIFSCGDPDAPELYTDPQTLAYALDRSIQKQIRFQCILTLSLLLYIGTVLFLIRGRFLYELFFMEQPRYLALLFLNLLVFPVGTCISALQIRKLVKTRRRLEQGLPMKAGRAMNWARFRKIYFFVFAPLLLVLIFSIPDYAPEFFGLDDARLSHTWPTLFQIEALGPRPLKEEPVVDGYVRQNRSRLVPVQERVTADWERYTRDPDTGEVSTLDRPYPLWLGIQYDRARSPWAARQTFQIRRNEAARELEKLTAPHYVGHVTDLQPFETLEYPGLDRLELVRFRQYEQDCWLFIALRGDEVLVVHYVGCASPEDCLPLFLAALDSP